MDRYKQHAKQQRHQTSDDGIACAAYNTGGDGPKCKGRIGGFFDRGAETDDGKRTDHAQRQNHIRCNNQDYQCGNHRQHNQTACKAFAEAYTAVCNLINQDNKQSQHKGQADCQQCICHRDRRKLFGNHPLDNSNQIFHISTFLTLYWRTAHTWIWRG